MQATFTARQWTATFTARTEFNRIPTTWDAMVLTWDDYDYLTWSQMTS